MKKRLNISLLFAAVLSFCFVSSSYAQKKPVIGVSSFVESGSVRAGTTYINSVRRAGGLPVVIPLTKSEEEIDAYLNQIDGIVLIGGEDISPLYFGAEPSPYLGEVVPDRDEYEIILIRKAVAKGIPLLGICRGVQVLNVAMGGTLIQDIPSEIENPIQHRQNGPRNYGSHTIKIEKGSLMAQLLGENDIAVNSFHHQAVKDVAPGYKVTATAKDGIIEAIESQDGKSFGVQFHPEGFVSAGDKTFLPIFQHLVQLAAAYAAKK